MSDFAHIHIGSEDHNLSVGCPRCLLVDFRGSQDVGTNLASPDLHILVISHELVGCKLVNILQGSLEIRTLSRAQIE